MSGGTPDDLFKFITPGRTGSNIWVQMRKGDNQKVRAVVDAVDEWMVAEPAARRPRAALGRPDLHQRGLAGADGQRMGKALAGSWVTVLIMMILLFRSVRLGILAMVPLTATILIIYGYVGLAGRNYDMPIAVLEFAVAGPLGRLRDPLPPAHPRHLQPQRPGLPGRPWTSSSTSRRRPWPATSW